MTATLAMQTGMAGRWSSTTGALARMPLWRLALGIGVLLAAAAALVTLLLGVADGRRLDSAGIWYGLVLAAVGLIGYAVSKQNVLNGSVVAGVAGVGLLLIGGGWLTMIAALLLLLGAVWAFATSYKHTAPQSQTHGTP